MMPVWFDTHAHLQDDDFAEDIRDVLSRARGAGVSKILLPASDLEDFRSACRLALSDPMLYVAAGVHPHEAKTWNEDSEEALLALIADTNEKALSIGRDAPVVAIGEIGLDFHYDFSPRDVQRTVFEKQLRIAHEVDLPVVIHIREAMDPALEILETAYAEGLFSKEHPAGVIHCYSDVPETLGTLLDMGFMIGFDGPVTYKKAKKARRSLEAVPDDRLVIETDAPWLSPRQQIGRRNESSYLPMIGEAAASIRGISVEALAAMTTENGKRLFRIS